jgi:hypothetical protein
MRTMQSVSMVWKLSLLAVATALTVSCAPGDLDNEPGEDGLDDDESSDSEEGLSTSVFELPFPCDQVWSGQTRTNHSPTLSIDFNRPDDFGDAIVASAAGKVTRVGNEGSVSYGKWIEIDHGSGYRTRYAHLSKQSVSMGQSVSRGQKIGELGNTGGSTGPHLHYELRLNGTPIKPVFNGTTSHGGSGAPGIVNTAGPDLTVRKSASATSEAVGSVPNGSTVMIQCQKQGSSVTGTYGTTTLWDFIGNGYVSDAYISTGSDGQVAPTCP